MARLDELMKTVERMFELEEKIENGNKEAIAELSQIRSAEELKQYRSGKKPVALAEWEKRAADGDAEAMYDLADYYKDYALTCDNKASYAYCKKAAKLFGQAAQLGHAEAECWYGGALISGYCVKKDVAKGVEFLARAAEKDCRAAFLSLAGVECPLLAESDDATVSHYRKRAFEKFKSLAEQGDAEAMFTVAEIIRCNVSLEHHDREMAEAAGWYEKAAAAGHAMAMLRIANMYSDGLTAECLNNHSRPNEIKAVFWKLKAAEAGHSDAMLSAARIFHYGLGGRQANKQKTAYWLQKAKESCNNARDLQWVVAQERQWQQEAESLKSFRKRAREGDTEAMISLAKLYRHGHGVEKDDEKAALWYAKAASAGNVRAMRHLGEFYFLGGAYRAKAFAWLKKGAKLGGPREMCALADFYGDRCDGDDKAEAVKWYEKAAKQGYAYAMYKLAELYASGRSSEDKANAFKWYQKAAEAGDTQAMQQLARCYKNGEGVELNIEQAIEVLRQIAAGDAVIGAIEACNEIADIYFAGENGDEDLNLAVHWYRLAARLENENGMYGLACCAFLRQDYLLSAYWRSKSHVFYFDNPEWDDRLDEACCKSYPELVGAIREKDYLRIINRLTEEQLVSLGDVYAKAGHWEAAADFWEHAALCGSGEAKTRFEGVQDKLAEIVEEDATFAEKNGCHSIAKWIRGGCTMSSPFELFF